MEEIEAANMARQRLNMPLLTVFGFAGPLMAAIGVYGCFANVLASSFTTFYVFLRLFDTCSVWSELCWLRADPGRRVNARIRSPG